MLERLSELRRRAQASGDPVDWQRASMAAQRLGLDLDGEPLPEQAFHKLKALGIVHPGRPDEAVLSPCGRFLATRSFDATLFWDVHNQSLLYVWAGSKRPAAFDADSKWVFEETNRANVLDLEAGFHVQELERSRFGRVVRPVPNENALLLVSAAAVFIYSCLRTERNRFVSDNGMYGQCLIRVAGDWIYWINEHRYNHELDKWECDFSLHSRKIEDGQHAESPPLPSEVSDFIVTDDGLYALTGQGQVWFVSLCLQSVQLCFGDPSIEEGILGLSPEERCPRLYVRKRESLECWDLEDQTRVWSHLKPSGSKATMAVSSGTGALVVSGINNSFEVIDPDTGECLRPQGWPAQAYQSLLFAGPTLVAVGQHTELSVYRVDRHAMQSVPVRQFMSLTSNGLGILGRVGRSLELVSLEEDSARRHWSLPYPLKQAVIHQRGITVANSRHIYKLNFDGDSERVYSADKIHELWLSPSGRLAAMVINSREFQVVDLDQGLVLIEWRAQKTPRVCFAQNETQACVAGWGAEADSQTYFVQLVDLATGHGVYGLDFPDPVVLANHLPANTIVYARANSVFVSSAPWKTTKELTGHQRPVVALSVNTDGQTLASVDDMGTVLLWTLHS